MGRALLSLAFLAAASGSSAHAAGGETALAFEAGPELADGRAAARLGLTAWRGLGPWLWLQAGASAQLTEDGQTGFEVQAGGAAALDVLRWVPWAELGAGVGRSNGRTGLLLRGGLGVDYMWAPRWGLGAVLRGRGLIRDNPQALGSVELRIVRRFGF